jgi:hypothetical protein
MRSTWFGLGLVSLTVLACSPTDPRFGSVAITATGTGADVCSHFDLNHDGTVTAVEIRQQWQNGNGAAPSDEDVTELLETCGNLDTSGAAE